MIFIAYKYFMNVLILTPDRVGSTLLQRLITVYMLGNNFDQPVINLHELTNGIMRYYSPLFKCEVLGKPNLWGYHQSLDQVTDMLSSVKHYKTARLAHYHIKSRGDSMAQQVPFYQYLNDNFFIISARRQNLLEHALSWCIKVHSKKLNVYSHAEKVDTFYDLYKNPIAVQAEGLITYLNAYRKYLAWVDNHFSVGSYFNYEKDLPQIEKYILDLPIFNNSPRLGWKETFGQDFATWNRCHYLLSDLSGISQQLDYAAPLSLDYNAAKSMSKYQLQPVDKTQVTSSLNAVDQKYLIDHGEKYTATYKSLEQLVEDKILVSSVPIKLQTMTEKQLIIKNFSECVDWYNDWSLRNGLGETYTHEHLSVSMQKELMNWHANSIIASPAHAPAIEQ